MSRQARAMSARTAATIRRPGFHAAGGVTGLYLQVSGSGGRSWTYRFTRDGRTRNMGLGSFADMPLAEAREAAAAARGIYLAGGDPIEARRAERGQEAVAKAKTITF